MEILQETSSGVIFLIILIALWEAVWKLIAMWKAARNHHLVWFICLAILNTAGILPIVYLLIYRNKSDDHKQ